MQLGKVIGHATATVKHSSLECWRLLLVQPLDLAGRPDGDPLLVLDNLGARAGDRVIMSSDGKGARELLVAANTPARWFVLGLADEPLNRAGLDGHATLNIG